MFCPDCGGEYREGFTVCAKCNVPLVSELPGRIEPEFIKFVTVHETGDPAFIAFVKSILESEGITYFIKGEGLQDLFACGRLGMGFNPVTGPVEIQVDEKDVERAKDLLSQIEEGEAEQPEADAEPEDEEERDKRTDRNGKRYSLKAVIGGFIIGVLISVLGFIVYDYREKYLSGVAKYDLNNDSKPDLFFHYKNGIIAKVEQDRNFDGRIDYWEYYKDNRREHGESDNNFDGIAETSFKFKDGLLALINVDTNGDNRPEIIEYFTHNILSEKVWLQESSPKIWKRALFEGGVMKEEYIDRDYDGTFDVKIVYDSSERPVKTESLH
jgi:hypothetical protein